MHIVTHSEVCQGGKFLEMEILSQRILTFFSIVKEISISPFSLLSLVSQSMLWPFWAGSSFVLGVGGAVLCWKMLNHILASTH